MTEATDKQLAYIESLMEQLGLSSDDVEHMIMETDDRGVDMSDLDVATASYVIDFLKGEM